MVIFHSYVSLPEGKPSKFSGYPFTDKPNYHETWLEYFAVTVDNQIQQDSHHLSCASRRALHCSHPWGKLIAAEMLRGITHHDGGFMWFQEYWFPCKVCLFHLVSSTCASHPQKTCLDASTSGVHGFPGLAAWTQHPFEGDVQNRQEGWVGHGGTLNLPSHVFDCFLGQNQTTPRHLPQDARETVPICCNYYRNICWNGKERSRVTSSDLSTYRYI